MQITSSSNPVIKEIKALRYKKAREESGRFYIEGLRIVIQALQEKKNLETLIWSPELLKSEIGRKYIENSTAQIGKVVEVSADVFNNISNKEGPQGIAAIAKCEYLTINNVEVKKDDLFIALDAVQDPGNLGTILRTADASSVSGIILMENSTDAYDPTAVRASMGAIFTQRIIRCSLMEFLHWKSNNHVQIYGASGNAKHNYHRIKYKRPLVLMMGSERQGLRSELIEMCDNLVKIPMKGKCDSLNLAIATGIILYEINNQYWDELDKGKSE